MANNLDRLFREGLDQYEVTPAPASWEQVHGQIAGKSNKGAIFMKVAAAMIILLAATITVIQFSKKEESTGPIANVDHPVIQQQLAFDWDIKINLSHPQEPADIIRKAPDQPVSESQPAFNPQAFETLTIASIREFHFDSDLQTSFTLKDERLRKYENSSVKITYIASNTPDSSKAPKFGQILNYLTTDLSPTDLLADIRDAKDSFFSKN